MVIRPAGRHFFCPDAAKGLPHVFLEYRKGGRGKIAVTKTGAQKLRSIQSMKSLLSNFTGWVSTLLFIAAVTVAWSGASVIVFLSGNRTLTEARS